MGGLVKAITKPFKSVIRSTVGSLLGGKQAAPQVIQQQAPAVAVADAPQVAPEVENGEGTSNEAAGRKGKRSVTVRRTSMGGGSGLNV